MLPSQFEVSPTSAGWLGPFTKFPDKEKMVSTLKEIGPLPSDIRTNWGAIDWVIGQLVEKRLLYTDGADGALEKVPPNWMDIYNYYKRPDGSKVQIILTKTSKLSFLMVIVGQFGAFQLANDKVTWRQVNSKQHMETFELDFSEAGTATLGLQVEFSDDLNWLEIYGKIMDISFSGNPQMLSFWERQWNFIEQVLKILCEGVVLVDPAGRLCIGEEMYKRMLKKLQDAVKVV
ncbi:hypothetical protein J3R30DRAFT_325765 [Lentinula aciculospora]|uniref:Uncharacterized protein n=1 Tax=Lentinula aciculospora TaxID=153920 RepID=A0A9W9A923_9AGAR|nr:hypothetical protein J3R30DRAFT_325765 [Lentinula aciculospora]